MSVLTAIMSLMMIPIAQSVQAQGSIFGLVKESSMSSPVNGDLSFWGFLNDSDEEIRIEGVVGAGYDNGSWFDDFQNYLTESPGNPYDYYFYGSLSAEGVNLSGLIPSNSFQQEDIQLGPVSWPDRPEGLQALEDSAPSVTVSWTNIVDLTYHVYRRVSTSGGSFFRVDNTSGDLSDRGVVGGVFVDVTVDGINSYDYLLIAENNAGDYSPHSTIAMSYAFVGCCLTAGDANNNGSVNIGDALFVIALVFQDGPSPECNDAADANGNNSVNIADAIYIINRVFSQGPAPVCGTTGS